ncbi:hypothetical protein H0H93_011445 [Arthromyces matolae]|nr:hypothetical protein H0H93_011445 [Arthromyces matolae]
MPTMATTKAARRAKFEDVFIVVRDELVAYLANEGLPDEVVDWYRLLQAYFLVADDLMDGSITRRGQPCWYRAPNPALSATGANNCPPVNLIAVNDAPMLKSAIFYLLRTHFRKESYYVDLMELFNDIAYKTEMGQLIDMVTAPPDVVDLARFSLERYKTIVKFKTAFYSFHLPVAAGMYMCHVPETYTVKLTNETKTIKPYDLALSIFIPLGEYFQVQDDFLDFSAPPEVLGKIGTDIVDNKCSWCINTALKLCTPEQRIILERNYGRKGDVETHAEGGEHDVKSEGTGHAAGGLCEARVKEVFEKVGLRKVYAEYEQEVYRQINELIDAIPEESAIVDVVQDGVSEPPTVLKKEVFRSFLMKIYGRGK